MDVPSPSLPDDARRPARRAPAPGREVPFALVAGAAAGLAAWRTGSVVRTLAAGMAGLHAARFLP